MIKRIFGVLLLLILVGGIFLAYHRLLDEKVCHDTNKCQDRLHSLETQLEFYSSDHVLALEKKSGEASERRAFYPADLAELAREEKGSVEFTTCPAYGVAYRYATRDDGQSFFAYCPARHRFHFDGQPFVNAIEPEAVDMHLRVEGGRVVNLEGEHANPWDFQTPTRRDVGSPRAPGTFCEAPTDIAASAFQMLAENPRALTRW